MRLYAVKLEVLIGQWNPPCHQTKA